MARQTFVMRDGKLIEKHLAPPLGGVFYVIGDGMDATIHPCTGKLMDSKSEFRRVTRMHGCIEMGNESPRIAPPDERAYRRELQNDIHRSMQMTEHRPAERASRYIEGY